MSQSRAEDDTPLAPPRSLGGGAGAPSGGRVIPPPPPELAEKEAAAAQAKEQAAREAEERAKQRAEEKARRLAERQAHKDAREAEKRAKATEKEAADKAAAEAAAAKAAADKEAADKEAAEKEAAAKEAASAPTVVGSPTSTAVRPGAAVPAASAVRSVARGRTRKARLRLVQVDAWSVMKTSFLLSLALGIVTVVAVLIVWSVLGAAGVWDSVNSIVQQALGSDDSSPFHIQKYVGTSRVLGLTMVLAVVDVILITAISTLAAFLYNLVATLLGGIEVTLAEDS